ncbi:hypothetical protein DIPPA_34222 [Diplonema papillatum]|nr:hypothetical protein DIPPA_34222 [Diplonema papillatum]
MSSRYAIAWAGVVNAPTARTQTAMSAFRNSTLRGHPCKMPFVATKGSPTARAVLKWRCMLPYTAFIALSTPGSSPITSIKRNMISCGSRSKHFMKSTERPNKGLPHSAACSMRRPMAYMTSSAPRFGMAPRIPSGTHASIHSISIRSRVAAHSL